MKTENVNIVWFKRDLRISDHQPISEALKSSDKIIFLYLFEPDFINYPDTSERHLRFIWESLVDMNTQIDSKRHSVNVLYGNALDVFDEIFKIYNVQEIFSYQESGVNSTWNRDKKIQKLCNSNGVIWKEFQRDGIIRGIKNRVGWSEQWHNVMHQQIAYSQIIAENLIILEKSIQLKFKLTDNLSFLNLNNKNEFQKGGSTMAWKYLKSFTDDRGKIYNKGISKPQLSRTSCSRLSPYISWGNISIRQAYQFVKSHANYPKNKRPFESMLTRLFWHCHFIQKFESECSYENTPVNIAYEKLKYEGTEAFLEAWKFGKTGFPLIDACMRCLYHTGWINFRMRAMMVSFLSHNLDLDWRSGSYHLAQMFLDYEPGIHFTQIQMQAGTSGINTLRIYNPVKQSYDNDPEGVFIKKWVPELSSLPSELIHEPWKITSMEAVLYEIEIGKDYPCPIVDYEQTSRNARTKLWGFKKSVEVKTEIPKIIELHTHNKKRKRNEPKKK